MKSGYTVIHSVISGDNAIEVINNKVSNNVLHLGWIFPATAYKHKDSSTVGIWKRKKNN